ncbi:MAG: PHP domain-containing protein [Anaerolineaceae bacterium]
MKVDFHCHTIYSPDSISQIKPLLRAAHAHGLDRLVITDHNRLQGALIANELEPEFVIMGEEIQTSYGEILAAFVKEEIPEALDPFKVIEILRSQGAFISVSHPFDEYRSGWPVALLEEIAPLVDAIETNNARVLAQGMNDEAYAFALEHHLAGTAGSDAHAPYEVGRMCLDLPAFLNAEELRLVIHQGQLAGSISPGWVHGFSMFARFAKRLRPNIV